MRSLRTVRIAVAALAVALLVVGVASAATTVPASLSISISPNKVGRVVGGVGTPVKLKTKIRFSHPSGSRIQLQQVKLLLPAGVGKPNGKLFPSCKADTLNRARGNLRRCPAGSKVGSGTAYGTAVDIGVSSSGRMTFFNGPNGKSLTLNVSIINPAQINATFSAPIKKLSGGKYGYSVTFKIPSQLQTILDGPIVVSRIDATVGATRTVNGKKRGFIEATKCPRSKRAPASSTFSFSDRSTSTADATLTCK